MIGRSRWARWQRTMLFAGVLTAAWVMLWDKVTVANIVAGLLVALGTLTVFPLPGRHEPQLTVRLSACGRLAAAVLAQLVTSNLLVSREIVSRNARLCTGIVAVRMRTSSPKLLSTVANILALSPGTMAVAAADGPPTLFVHVLALDDIVAVRRRVARLERLVIDAFGATADRRALLVNPDGAPSQPTEVRS